METKGRKEGDLFADFCAMYSASIVEGAKMTFPGSFFSQDYIDANKYFKYFSR